MIRGWGLVLDQALAPVVELGLVEVAEPVGAADLVVVAVVDSVPVP